LTNFASVQNFRKLHKISSRKARLILRTRRYVGRHWLALLRPLFRYSYSRDAFVLRIVGRSVGPVLRAERRVRRDRPMDGVERREASLA
jgi:hypothetical protein